MGGASRSRRAPSRSSQAELIRELMAEMAPRRRGPARARGCRARRQRRLRGGGPLDVGAPGRSDRADRRLDRRPADPGTTEVHVTHHRIVIVGTGFSGHRHGDPAAAGGRARLRAARARRATSAGPGATTPTRAVAATCPRTSTRSRSRPTRAGRAPSRRSRRSSSTCAEWPTASASCRTFASTPSSSSPSGTTDEARWRHRDLAGPDHGRRPDHRAGPAQRPAACRTSPASTASRARPSTRPTGTTATTWRASAWRWSAPAPRRSSSCPRSSRRWASCTSSSAPPPWVIPHPNRPLKRWERAHLPAPPAGPARHARRHLLGARDVRAPVPQPRACASSPRAWRCASSSSRSTTPSCAPS